MGWVCGQKADKKNHPGKERVRLRTGWSVVIISNKISYGLVSVKCPCLVWLKNRKQMVREARLLLMGRGGTPTRLVEIAM